MKVLVTGATGFIGSHVVRELLRRGHLVHGLVRPATRMDRLHDVAGDVTTWPVDLRDAPAVDDAISAIGAEAVVHLAWYAEPGAYLRHLPQNLASLEAGVHLLRSLMDSPARRVVLAGTCLEDRRSAGHEPIYAVAKRALHEVAMAGFQDRGPSVACAHVFSVFGPWEDERRALPSLIRALRRKQPVDVGAGTQLRDYTYVEDVAGAIVTILESDAAGGIDVCSGEPRPLRQVFEEVGRATGGGHLFRFGARPQSADEAFDAVGDPAALHALGWRPARSFADRIDETVAWWQTQTAVPATAGSR
ncbi:MAG: NAD-dependent epimerase/dehydratase family protein [Acidimicrobiales bacterium]